jgi:hypothetical protein
MRLGKTKRRTTAGPFPRQDAFVRQGRACIGPTAMSLRTRRPIRHWIAWLCVRPNASAAWLVWVLVMQAACQGARNLANAAAHNIFSRVADGNR